MDAEYWKIVMFLWLLPVTLALAAAVRWVRQGRIISEYEQPLLFRDDAEVELTPWLVIKIALLAVLLFFVGLALGLIVVNLGFPWTALVPLGTALATMLLLADWLRSAPDKKRRRHETPGTHEKKTSAERMDAFEF